MTQELQASARKFIRELAWDYRRGYLDAPTGHHPVDLAMVLEKLDRLYAPENGAVPDNRIQIGSLVDLVDTVDGSRLSVKVTLPRDSDPANGWISVLSPLGAALLGLAAGEQARIFLGNHTGTFIIIGVK